MSLLNLHKQEEMLVYCVSIVQLIGEREVRGVVKLKFRDVTGAVIICHRMLLSVQKVNMFPW